MSYTKLKSAATNQDFYEEEGVRPTFHRTEVSKKRTRLRREQRRKHQNDTQQKNGALTLKTRSGRDYR